MWKYYCLFYRDVYEYMLIIIVGSVLPFKKVLNSQRSRPAKPLGPRALRIPPSIPDSKTTQAYQILSHHLLLLATAPRLHPFLLFFCWSNHRYVRTHQKQEGRLSSRPVSTAMRFSSIPLPPILD